MSVLIPRHVAFNRPIWIGETGTNAVTSTRFPADYLGNVYRLIKSRCARQAPVVFLMDPLILVRPLTGFGLHDTAGKAKPAYTRYPSLAGAG